MAKSEFISVEPYPFTIFRRGQIDSVFASKKALNVTIALRSGEAVAVSCGNVNDLTEYLKNLRTELMDG